MIIVGLLLSVLGIGFLCWLLFTLAVYALPFYIGMSAGFAAYHSGAGVIGACLVGLFAGVLVLVIGQVAFAVVASPFVRGSIAVLFAAPATIAGYHATLGFAQIGAPSGTWCELFAVIGATVVGGTAFVRVTRRVILPLPGRVLAGGSAQRLLPQPPTGSTQA